MATPINTVKTYIAGAESDFPLEHRIFNVSSFFITSFAVLAGFANYLIGLETFTIWFSFVGAAVSFILYYAARFWRLFSLFTVFAYLLATISILSVMHFYNGGMSGTIIYLIIMLLNIFLLILPRRYQYWVYGLLYANILGLLLVEYFYPGLVVPYKSKEEKILDHAVTMLYSLFYTTLVIISFRRSYYTEREKVVAQNNQLIVLNEQIEDQKQALEYKTEALETAVQRANQQNENIKTLLKELNHRVKNNLQVVSSLLNLQAHSITDEKAKSAILESKHRLVSMILIHQQLYHDENATQVFMPDYLKELAECLMLTFTGHLDEELISYRIEPLNIQVDKAIPLGLICNELITNCFKYAFLEDAGCHITISLKQQDNQYQLSIADNGKGIAAPVNSKSFGMELVKSLVLQLNGTYKVTSDSGTCWEIAFN
jgi:two-component sensor histidine kinase